MSSQNLPPVLLIEDSPGDIELAQRAVARSELRHPLIVAEDGDEALALLAGNPRFGREPLYPALVILDLNLPGLDGRQVLRRIKLDVHWQHLPVVVLSTSNEPNDITACYQLGANGYHRKPDDYRTYQDLIREIIRYWLGSSIVSPMDMMSESYFEVVSQ